MRRTMTGLFAAALALGLFIAVPGFAHHPDPEDHPQGKHGKDTNTVHTCGENTVTYEGPEWMWPPNHKQRDLTVTAAADEPEDEVALATQGTHDEYTDPESHTEMNGAGNTENDIEPFATMDSGTGSAQTEHKVRAERSGRGIGRTYTIHYQAWFGDLDPETDDPTCTDEFKITVPHSMGNSANVKKNHNPNHED